MPLMIIIFDFDTSKLEELKVHMWHVMLKFKNYKNATETAQKICNVYG